MDRGRFLQHLEQLGYYDLQTTGRLGLVAAPQSILDRSAVSTFQARYGLPVTGDADDYTLAFADQPRCGFPDFGEFVTSGQKWNTNSLRYTFQEMTLKLQQSQVLAEAQAGFDIWAAVCNLTFTRVTGDVELVCRFVRGDHGDGNPFDGPSNILAHAYFPMAGVAIAGDMHFDEDENWSVGGGGIDLRTVWCHEAGHALGLNHTPVQGSMMYPYYGGPKHTLGPDDVAGIQSLYGVRVQTPTNLNQRLAQNLMEGIYTVVDGNFPGPNGGKGCWIRGQGGETVDLATGIEVF